MPGLPLGPFWPETSGGGGGGGNGEVDALEVGEGGGVSGGIGTVAFFFKSSILSL